jgi:hypothetical protein
MLQRNKSGLVPNLAIEPDQAFTFQIPRQRHEKYTFSHWRAFAKTSTRLSRLKCCTAKAGLARPIFGRSTIADDVTQPSNSIRYWRPRQVRLVLPDPKAQFAWLVRSGACYRQWDAQDEESKEAAEIAEL